MELERYFYSFGNIYNTAEYLTPLRVYDICRADIEGDIYFVYKCTNGSMGQNVADRIEYFLVF